MGIFDFKGKDSLSSVIARYEKLSSEKPENSSLKNTLGDLYFKKGNTEKALKYYKETIDLLLKSRQKEKALAIVKKSIAYGIFDIKSTEEIADNLLSKGMKQDAISIYVQLAKKKLHTNRTTANDIFRKILEFDPDNQEALLFFKKGKPMSEGISKDENLVEVQAKASFAADSPETASESLNISDNIYDKQDFKKLDLDNKTEEENKTDLKLSGRPLPSFSDAKSGGAVSDEIKNKFLTVAKEKNYLETIIIQQNDIIAKLEKEKNNFSNILSRLEDENKMIKSRLRDADNAQLTEENAKLKSEIILLQVTIDELQEIAGTKENEISGTKNDLSNAASIIGHIEAELASVQNRCKEIEKERDMFKVKIDVIINQLSDLTQEKLSIEGELNQKTMSYSAEMDKLKDKIDELTKLSEEKVPEDELKETISFLHSELIRKDERLAEDSEGYKKEKEELTAKISNIEKTSSKLEEENKKLFAEIEVIRNKALEYSNIIEGSDKFHMELKEQLSGLQEKIIDLENESNTYLTVISSKDQLLTELKKEHDLEISALRDELGSLRPEKEEMKKRIYEKEQDINILSIEKEDLLKRVADFNTELDKLQNEKHTDISGIQDELNSALRKITGLETSIDNSLNENSELRKKLQEITESVNEKTLEVPAPSDIISDIKSDSMPEFGDKIIFKKKKKWPAYAVFSVLLLLIVVGLAVSLYKLFNYYNVEKFVQKTDDLPVADENLNYNAIFNLMTRVEASKNTKFQATIITKSLLHKENAGENSSTFDFKNFIYFKVNINSLKARLRLDFIKNPASGLKLTEGTASVLPDEGSRIEELKTFYRGKTPVSVTFLYVFPKKKVSPDLKQLQLLMNDNGSEMRLTWDAQMLKSSKVIP